MLGVLQPFPHLRIEAPAATCERRGELPQAAQTEDIHAALAYAADRERHTTWLHAA